jgi:putative ABC transport system permease protein
MPDTPESPDVPRRVVNYGVKYHDVDALMAAVPAIKKVLPVREIRRTVRHMGNVIDGRVVGTTHDYGEFNRVEMDCGRFLVEDDNVKAQNHAVLGSAVAEARFPLDDPIGQAVKLGTDYYTVVGVVKDRADTSGVSGGLKAQDFNKDVYIPLNTCKLRFGERIVDARTGRAEEFQLSRIILRVYVDTDIDDVANKIRAAVKARHPKGDAEVVTLNTAAGVAGAESTTPREAN